jgi:tRNA G18 (ribose-2'-O)-methylase SpoU
MFMGDDVLIVPPRHASVDMGYTMFMIEHTNEVGVGPHSQPFPDGPQYDVELLANGDRRNVEDKYRYWTVESIKADLDAKRVDLHVAIENWQHDINIGTIVRNANAFNVAAVHIIGKRHWNRRGAMVTDRYLTIIHHATVEEFVEVMKNDKRHVIAIDNFEGATPLAMTTLPQHSVLVFGSEGPGLSDEMVAASEQLVMIEQFGSTRSVNVGVAAGIVMYSWMQQNHLTK